MSDNFAQSYAQNELQLYVENNWKLYKMRLYVEGNQRKHKARGVWDFDKCVKAYQNLMYFAARKYCDEFGGNIRYAFPLKTVLIPLAKAYAQDFQNSFKSEAK